MSPTVICWGSKFQCDIIWWWSLGEVIRITYGHEGGALMIGWAPLQEETPESFFLTHLHKEEGMWAQSWMVAAWKQRQEVLKGNLPCWHVHLGRPASKTEGNKFLLCKPCSLWHLLWQTELTKILLLAHLPCCFCCSVVKSCPTLCNQPSLDLS